MEAVVAPGRSFPRIAQPRYAARRPEIQAPSRGHGQDVTWQFWIDRGGTFTDVVARRPDGALVTHKLRVAVGDVVES
jgi:hypothetical protein